MWFQLRPVGRLPCPRFQFHHVGELPYPFQNNGWPLPPDIQLVGTWLAFRVVPHLLTYLEGGWGSPMNIDLLRSVGLPLVQGICYGLVLGRHAVQELEGVFRLPLWPVG